MYQAARELQLSGYTGRLTSITADPDYVTCEITPHTISMRGPTQDYYVLPALIPWIKQHKPAECVACVERNRDTNYKLLDCSTILAHMKNGTIQRITYVDEEFYPCSINKPIYYVGMGYYIWIES